MKKKYLFATILPLLAFAAIGTVSAHGLGFGWFGSSATPDEIATRQQQIFDQQAKILGISVDDVKNAWADGKTIQQIIEDKGLDKTAIQKRAQDEAIAQMKTQLQTLVDKGIISQPQADKRLAGVQTNIQNGKGFRGFGRGMGFLMR